MEGIAEVAMLLRSRAPEDIVDDGGVGRRGCAIVRCGGEWVISRGSGTRAVGCTAGGDVGSSKMWFEISCAIAEVGRKEGMCEVRLFVGSGGCTRVRLLMTFSHSLMGRSWL
jgi:hypothetical protein